MAGLGVLLRVNGFMSLEAIVGMGGCYVAATVLHPISSF